MPWNNQNSGGGDGGGGGGGWKGGGGGPWGQGGGGGGGGGGSQPPDLEEFLKRGQDRLKQVMPGSGLPGPLFLLLAALATAVLGFYAFTFQVKPDEQGVVLRFGQYVRWSRPDCISAGRLRSRRSTCPRSCSSASPRSACAQVGRGGAARCVTTPRKA